MIAARDPTDHTLEDMAQKINQGVEHLRANRKETVEHITSTMEYSKADAVAWRVTVKYPDNVRGVDVGVIQKTIELLQKASVLDENCTSAGEMVGIRSSSAGDEATP